MGVFNKNIAFLCKKEGFKSVQKFADYLGEPRTKVAEYFKKSNAKPEFHAKLVQKFGIDLNMFLTVELDDHNYSMLFTSKKDGTSTNSIEEDKKEDDFFDLAQRVKEENDQTIREALIQRLIKIHASKLNAIDKLKDEIMKQLKEKEDLLKRF